ncbi:MAG: hypothetical protein CMI26_08725 [Opitutae bacterium]|nr:hypothetical protein [Opitutae bacterium]
MSSNTELQVAALRTFINHVNEKTSVVQIPTPEEARQLFNSHVQGLVREGINKMIKEGRRKGTILLLPEHAEVATLLLSQSGYEVVNKGKDNQYYGHNVEISF